MTAPEELKWALKASIEHWKENVALAQSGKLTTDRIGADRCVLCGLFPGRCTGCPLEENGYGCCEENSPWKYVFRALMEGTNPVIPAKQMLFTLYEVADKLDMEDLQ